MLDKKTKNPPAGGGSDTSRTQLDQQLRSLSREARQRLKWMEHFRKYRNARLTCRHFGISPSTFYLWKRRFDSGGLKTLEDDLNTRRPRKVRISKHKAAQLETIRRLKDLDPRLGKTRIAKILNQTGAKISSSTVTRILKVVKNNI